MATAKAPESFSELRRHGVSRADLEETNPGELSQKLEPPLWTGWRFSVIYRAGTANGAVMMSGSGVTFSGLF